MLRKVVIINSRSGMLFYLFFTWILFLGGTGLAQQPDSSAWLMFRHDISHTGLSPLTGNMDTCVVGWSYSTGGEVRSSPALGDIDGDGSLEVVVGSNDNKIYALNGEAGSVLWSYTTGNLIEDSSPALGDIDGDGSLEVVIGSNDNKVYALEGGDGSVLWSYTTGSIVSSSPVLGDIDGDGLLEVVVGSGDANVYALNGENGSLLWSHFIGSGVTSSPALGDIDGDDTLEVVFGSNYDHKVNALNGEDGSVLWSYTTGGEVRPSPALGDIDGDGLLEVVVGSYDNKVYALNGEDGSFIWSHATADWVLSSAALGDIDNDGSLEVVFGGGSFDNKVYALEGGDGSVLWIHTTGSWIHSSPALGDIDGDGLFEVIVGSSDSKVYALNGENGSFLWSYTTWGVVYSSPALGDIDGDGLLEVVVGANDYKIYALNGEFIELTSPNGGENWIGGTTHPITWTAVGTGFESYRLLYSTDGGSSYPDTIAENISPDSTSWIWTIPTINNSTCKVKVQILDADNYVINEDASDSIFAITSETGIIGKESLPSKFSLSQNYPNPFNPTTTVRFGLPEAQRVLIKIHSITGATIKTLVDDYLSKGHHQVVWNGLNESGNMVASGIYIYEMRTKDKRFIKKMLLTK